MRTLIALKTSASILVAASLALGLATAAAQSPPSKMAEAFKANDKNKDGKLAKAEFIELAKALGMDATAETAWTSTDKNKDGFVTEAEFNPNSGRPGSPAEMAAALKAGFKPNDKNKDGKLSKPEFLELAKGLGASGPEGEDAWRESDANKDGFVSEAEFAVMVNGSGGGQRAVAVGGPGGGVAIASDEQRMAAFKANDKNKDGKLSKAEYVEVLNALGYPGQVETFWPQRDLNKDGFITEAEFKPAIAGGVSINIAPPQ